MLNSLLGLFGGLTALNVVNVVVVLVLTASVVAGEDLTLIDAALS